MPVNPLDQVYLDAFSCYHVLEELLQTESRYVQQLDSIVQHYCPVMHQAACDRSCHVGVLRVAVAMLHMQHAALLHALQQALNSGQRALRALSPEDCVQIELLEVKAAATASDEPGEAPSVLLGALARLDFLQCLQDAAPVLMPLYQLYVRHCDAGLAALRAVAAADPERAAVLEGGRAPGLHPAWSLLLAPIQRVPRYELLLKTARKSITKLSASLARLLPDATQLLAQALTHTHHELSHALQLLSVVLDDISTVAQTVNDGIAEGEVAAQLAAARAKLHVTDAHAVLAATPGRRILAAGSLTKLCRRGLRRYVVLLTTEALLYCSTWKSKATALADKLPTDTLDPSQVSSAAWISALLQHVPPLRLHRVCYLAASSVSALGSQEPAASIVPAARSFKLLNLDKSVVFVADTVAETESWLSALRLAVQAQHAQAVAAASTPRPSLSATVQRSTSTAASTPPPSPSVDSPFSGAIGRRATRRLSALMSASSRRLSSRPPAAAAAAAAAAGQPDDEVSSPAGSSPSVLLWQSGAHAAQVATAAAAARSVQDFTARIERACAPLWVPDRAVQACALCHEPFRVIRRRRHHCRVCGRCVCHACSDHSLVVEQLTESGRQRVCDACFKAADSVRGHVLRVDVAMLRRRAASTVDGSGGLAAVSARTWEHSPAPLMLRVRAMGARFLAAMDRTGTSDPYVRTAYCGTPVAQTEVCPRQLNPVWSATTAALLPVQLNDEAAYTAASANVADQAVAGEHIEFTVFDRDVLLQDDFLGRCSLRVRPLLRSSIAVFKTVVAQALPPSVQHAWLHSVLSPAQRAAPWEAVDQALRAGLAAQAVQLQAWPMHGTGFAALAQMLPHRVGSTTIPEAMFSSSSSTSSSDADEGPDAVSAGERVSAPASPARSRSSSASSEDDQQVMAGIVHVREYAAQRMQLWLPLREAPAGVAPKNGMPTNGLPPSPFGRAPVLLVEAELVYPVEIDDMLAAPWDMLNTLCERALGTTWPVDAARAAAQRPGEQGAIPALPDNNVCFLNLGHTLQFLVRVQQLASPLLEQAGAPRQRELLLRLLLLHSVVLDLALALDAAAMAHMAQTSAATEQAQAILPRAIAAVGARANLAVQFVQRVPACAACPAAILHAVATRAISAQRTYSMVAAVLAGDAAEPCTSELFDAALRAAAAVSCPSEALSKPGPLPSASPASAAMAHLLGELVSCLAPGGTATGSNESRRASAAAHADGGPEAAALSPARPSLVLQLYAELIQFALSASLVFRVYVQPLLQFTEGLPKLLVAAAERQLLSAGAREGGAGPGSAGSTQPLAIASAGRRQSVVARAVAVGAKFVSFTDADALGFAASWGQRCPVSVLFAGGEKITLERCAAGPLPVYSQAAHAHGAWESALHADIADSAKHAYASAAGTSMAGGALHGLPAHAEVAKELACADTWQAMSAWVALEEAAQFAVRAMTHQIVRAVLDAAPVTPASIEGVTADHLRAGFAQLDLAAWQRTWQPAATACRLATATLPALLAATTRAPVQTLLTACRAAAQDEVAQASEFLGLSHLTLPGWEDCLRPVATHCAALLDALVMLGTDPTWGAEQQASLEQASSMLGEMAAQLRSAVPRK